MRNFYRCRSCLSVVAVDGKMPHGAVCGACGRSGWWHMGEVHQDRLVKVEDRCACDDRCTSARGPKCNCRCGGKNHGTHLVVTVVTDQGKVPLVKVPSSDEAHRIADEWDAATSGIRAELDELMNTRGWLPQEKFNRKLSLQWRLSRAAKLKTHAARLKLLAEGR